ncbi:hypothetical protein B0H15DRAFT_905496 [Mycena belliarum]|uniref:Glycosyltransferase family 1 protein n=1 Tax=Mycena belliarum TaxID=1033014 RepID=A0AAD6U6L2_9AGAR|nr:hypothetical protein B0H15DRAFT_905496 [Mycena belliae]
MAAETHHIVALLIPGWGHVVNYISLAIQMLKHDPALVITLFEHNLVVPQMEKELKTLEYDEKRLRIIGVGEGNLPFSPTQLADAFAELAQGWMKWLAESGPAGESAAWPKPHAIHMDFFIGGLVIDKTKEIMGPACKTLLWFSSPAAAMPCHLSDYDFAKLGDEIFADDTRRQGRSMEEILHQIILAWNGTDRLSGMVVKCPGMPDMYDYERVSFSDEMPPAPGMAHLFIAAQKFGKLADGYITPTATCLEPVGVPQCRELYAAQGKNLFTIGVQAHELCWTEDLPSPPPITNETVKAFLKNRPPRSVLYISFGSLFFPPNQGLVKALVDTLLELDFPFLFALGGKMASLPADLIESVNSSGKGLICNFWVEQRAILLQGTIGWFLTHGGFNSISEALSQRIPLIIWPLSAEQPINAAFLSSGPRPVAIELRQVRPKYTVAPPYESLRGAAMTPRGNKADAVEEFRKTFENARGEIGASLTKNAIEMGDGLRTARKGEAVDEIRRLAKF